MVLFHVIFLVHRLKKITVPSEKKKQKKTMNYGMYWMYYSYKNQIIVLESLPGFTCKIQVIKRERDESNK